MRKQFYNRILITKVLLGTLILSVALGNMGFACNKNDPKVRQLAKANDDVGEGLLTVATILRDSKANGTISQADVDFLKPILKEIGEGNKKTIEIGKSLNELEDIPLNKQQELLQAISFVTDTVTTLNNEGALRIKDPSKRALFSAVVLAMQSSITSVVIILNLKGQK